MKERGRSHSLGSIEKFGATLQPVAWIYLILGLGLCRDARISKKRPCCFNPLFLR